VCKTLLHVTWGYGEEILRDVLWAMLTVTWDAERSSRISCVYIFIRVPFTRSWLCKRIYMTYARA